MDRCITALNVTGDTVVSCIIARNVPLTEVEGLHDQPLDADSTKGTKHADAVGSFDSDSAEEEEATSSA